MDVRLVLPGKYSFNCFGQLDDTNRWSNKWRRFDGKSNYTF